MVQGRRAGAARVQVLGGSRKKPQSKPRRKQQVSGSRPREVRQHAVHSEGSDGRHLASVSMQAFRSEGSDCRNLSSWLLDPLLSSFFPAYVTSLSAWARVMCVPPDMANLPWDKSTLKIIFRPLSAAYPSLVAPGLVHLCSLKDFTTLSQDLSISVLQTEDFSTFAQDLPGLVPQQTLSQCYKRIISYTYERK